MGGNVRRRGMGMKQKKYMKYIIQMLAGLVLSALVMLWQGVFSRSDPADIVRGISDSFTVTAFLFVGVGILVWISTTGFFDIFGFAFKKGLHHILPVFIRDDPGGFYEYKQEKEERRAVRTQRSTLIVGLFFLAASLVSTFVWYAVAG